MKKIISIMLLAFTILPFFSNAFAAQLLTTALSENGANAETARMITAVYRNENALSYSTTDKERITEFFDQIAQFSITPIDGDEMAFNELSEDSMYIRILINKEGPPDYRSIFVKDSYIVIANTKVSGVQVVATNQKHYTVDDLKGFRDTVHSLRHTWLNLFDDEELYSQEPVSTPTPKPVAKPEPRQRAVLEGIKKYYTGEFTIPISNEQKESWLGEFVGDSNALKLRFGVLHGTHTDMDTTRTRYAEEFNFNGYFYLELMGSEKTETWISFKKEGHDTIVFDSATILEGNKLLSYGNYPTKSFNISRSKITLTFDVDMQRRLQSIVANIYYEKAINTDEYVQLGNSIPVDMTKYHSNDSMDFMIYGKDINGDGKWSITFFDLHPVYRVNNYDTSISYKSVESETGYIMEFDLKLDSTHAGSWLQSSLGNNIHVKWDIRKGAQTTIMELTGKDGEIFRGSSYVLTDSYDGQLHQFKSDVNIYKDGEKRYDGRKYEGGFIVELKYNDDNTLKDIIFTLIRPLVSPAKQKQRYYADGVHILTEGVMYGDQISIDMDTLKAEGNPANLVLMRKRENRGDVSYALLKENIWQMQQQPYFGLLRYTSPDNGDVVDFSVDFAMEFPALGQLASERDYEWLRSYQWREDILSEGCKDVQLSFVATQRYLNNEPTYPITFLKVKGDIGEKWFISSATTPLQKGEKDAYQQYEAVNNKSLTFDFVPLADFVGFNFYEMSASNSSICLTIEFDDDAYRLAHVGFFGGYPLPPQKILSKDINYTGDGEKLYYKWATNEPNESLTEDKAND